MNILQLPCCNQCGQRFYRAAAEPWKPICIVCWKTEHGFKITKSDREMVLLADECYDATCNLERLIDRNQALRNENERLRAENDVSRLFRDRETVPAIPTDIAKRLRGLVHPDRWAGTPQERSATVVSQWLQGARS